MSDTHVSIRDELLHNTIVNEGLNHQELRRLTEEGDEILREYNRDCTFVLPPWVNYRFVVVALRGNLERVLRDFEREEIGPNEYTSLAKEIKLSIKNLTIKADNLHRSHCKRERRINVLLGLDKNHPWDSRMLDHKKYFEENEDG